MVSLEEEDVRAGELLLSVLFMLNFQYVELLLRLLGSCAPSTLLSDSCFWASTLRLLFVLQIRLFRWYFRTVTFIVLCML